MARKSINRTIDKKLWLTVSSIISRNRSTEAEEVKPIGNDKDNLLQRYVAALLIMKKSCPNTIEDIGKLKTFKKIGYKFIDLGGTIQDIQKLYNENSGNNTNIATSLPHDNNVTSNDNTSEDDDDFWTDFGKNVETEDADDSFLSDIDTDISNQYEDAVYQKMEELTAKITNKSDLETVYYKVVPGKFRKPTKFTLIKPTNVNEYQYYIYSLETSNYSGYNKGKQLYSDLKYDHNWKSYVNPVFDMMQQSKKSTSNIDLFPGYSTYHFVSDTTSYVLPVDINETCNTLSDIHKYLKDVYDINDPDLLKTHDSKYRQILSTYKNIDNTVNNKAAAKLFKKSSFITEALVSPDNGLVLYTQYNITNISNSPNHKNITDVKQLQIYLIQNNIDQFLTICFQNEHIIAYYSYNYILTFTGENTYNDILLDADFINNKALFKKDKSNHHRQWLVFRNMVFDYASGFFRYYTYKQVSDLNFQKIGNTYGMSLQYDDNRYIGNVSNKRTIVDEMWGKNNPDLVNMQPTYRKHKGQYAYTIKGINNTQPGVIASVKTTNNIFVLKQFKTYGNTQPVILLELLPKGLEIFKQLCTEKKIPILT